jgi:hypothetical protein
MLGENYLKTFPDITAIARESRAFLERAVQYLAGNVKIRQFLDIGVGYPTASNMHKIAQRVAPGHGSYTSTTILWLW